MTRIILVYGSTMGNTEILAGSVVEGLESGNVEVTVRNVTEVEPEELTNYDMVILGCSTWGEGELQDDFIEFYDRMEEISLKGKKSAVFGPGDSEIYPDSFCKAVDILEEILIKCEAKIIVESLKVDGEVEPAFGDAEAWGLKITKLL